MSPPSSLPAILTAATETSTGTAILADLKKLEARAAAFNELARQVNAEEAACLKELARCKKDITALRKDTKLRKTGKVGATTSKTTEDDNDTDATPPPAPPPLLQSASDDLLEDRLDLLRRKLTHLEYQFPKPAHIILRLALGSHAPVSLKPLQLRLAYKHEYELFKLRFTLVFVGLATMGLVVSSRVLDAIYGFAMLYYYCTCVLREHILLVNGSRIRSWWFGHHYVSIVLAGVMLIWPASPSYHAFRPHFYAFAVYVSAMQYLQFRYQRARLYVLVALDRARPMDTVAGEGAFPTTSNVAGRELRTLLPFLAVGQFWQLVNAGLLLKPSAVEGFVERHEWQGVAVGLLFGILAVGNTLATVRTWRAKKATGRRPGSSALDPGSPPASPVAVLAPTVTAYPFPSPTSPTATPNPLRSS
ncbi:hypothetical protein HKX48_002290 [Thoreauomyces humboldtii]|nr:hypothetical protein HKX48_002290 [Thoreauomyces humboldtii]